MSIYSVCSFELRRDNERGMRRGSTLIVSTGDLFVQRLKVNTTRRWDNKYINVPILTGSGGVCIALKTFSHIIRCFLFQNNAM